MDSDNCGAVFRKKMKNTGTVETPFRFSVIIIDYRLPETVFVIGMSQIVLEVIIKLLDVAEMPGQQAAK